MIPYRTAAWTAVVVAVCVAAAVPRMRAAAAAERSPVPAAEVVEAARARIRSEWREDYARAEAAAKSALADRALARAEAGTDDAAFRYALATDALSLAAECGAFDRAVAAARVLARDFVDPATPPAPRDPSPGGPSSGAHAVPPASSPAELLAAAVARRMHRPERLGLFRSIAEAELAGPRGAAASAALAKSWDDAGDKATAEGRTGAARQVRAWSLVALGATGPDDPARAETDALLRRANAEIEKADARSGRFSLLEGRWVVTFADGSVSAYSYAADGTTTIADGGAADGSPVPVAAEARRLPKLTRRSGAVIAARGGGKQLMRVWVEGDVLLVEPFDAAAKPPDAPRRESSGVRDSLPAGASVALARARTALRAGDTRRTLDALDSAARAAPGDGEVARRRAAIEVCAKVLSYAVRMSGTTVGDGECWTLADAALRDAGAQHPEIYVFGRALGPGEEILGGDIVQFEGVRFEGDRGTFQEFPHHTAIVARANGRRVSLLHQNWGAPGRIVSHLDVDLARLARGKLVIFRPLAPGQ